ncbi:MAG: aminotransferase class III-fold pyridoxal phosphate-dependent enzyme [Kineosporiaceae bacterium]|nr:aminotransferase class III-fold pyridoxal phosphate-dependent enzyme [Kineosporiaceae bacterium]
MIARLLITLAVSAHREPQHLDNTDYITQYDADSQALLDRLTAITPGSLRGRLRRLAGLGAPGLPGAPASSSQDLLTRRRAVQARGLSPLFYAEPLDIVAAEGVWLTARDGRRYLDGYNNVAVVGPDHPSVVSAITRQAPVLHTHSRYLHPNVIELAERLVASMPPGSGLDTCLFTASGTEANELAWRLSVEYTSAVAGRPCRVSRRGRRGDHRLERLSRVLAVAGRPVVHGVARRVSACGRGHLRRPGAARRPAHARRRAGPHRGRCGRAARGRAPPGHSDRRLDVHQRRRADRAARVHGGSGGRRPRGRRALRRRRGADRVRAQRTQAVVVRRAGRQADVVTMGKPMGAGYPIAATITRREIADVLASRYEFFSTFAGNPVGTAASLAVLDILEDQVIDGLRSRRTPSGWGSRCVSERRRCARSTSGRARPTRRSQCAATG